MSATMRAAVCCGPNCLKLESVPLPAVPEGSIRVRVRAVAICGTDRRILTQGDYRAAYPVILGHEIAGEVDAVAPGVTSLRPGDRVCVAPGHGCGKCAMCRKGRPNVCLTPHPSLGYRINGGFAEYIAVPEHIFRLGFVNRIPDNLSYEQASLSEIIACCLNAHRNAPVGKGDNVLILGAGPAGIIHALLSRLEGAGKVLISQRSRGRLDAIGERFPGLADRLICSREEELFAAVREACDGCGPDVIYVCAPSREAQEQALQLVNHRGRVCFFGGLPQDDAIVRLDANALHYKEFFISGASSSLPETNREALRLLSERAIDADKLITHVFPLEEIREAFAVMESRACIKIVIRP